MKKSILPALSLSAAAVLAAAPAAATTWDAATDFATAAGGNPGAVWSYGYDPASVDGYQIKLFDIVAVGSVAQWNDSQYSSLGTPAAWKNLSGSTILGVVDGQVALHPGPTPNGDYAILRFTAPTTGVYSVSAQFFTGDSGEVDAWVVKNGGFGSPLASLGETSSNPLYSVSGLYLDVGDTLDFVVGNHGNYFYDTTPVTVQITSVPEPAAAGLSFLGLAAMAAALRLRKRG